MITSAFSNNDLTKAIAIYSTIREKIGLLDSKILNIILEVFVKTQNEKEIVDVFNTFKTMSIHPAKWILAKICNMQNIPD